MIETIFTRPNPVSPQIFDFTDARSVFEDSANLRNPDRCPAARGQSP